MLDIYIHKRNKIPNYSRKSCSLISSKQPAQLNKWALLCKTHRDIEMRSERKVQNHFNTEVIQGKLTRAIILCLLEISKKVFVDILEKAELLVRSHTVESAVLLVLFN